MEGDASSASYFLAGATISGGTVVVEGCGSDSLQGDVRFAEVRARGRGAGRGARVCVCVFWGESGRGCSVGSGGRVGAGVWASGGSCGVGLGPSHHRHQRRRCHCQPPLMAATTTAAPAPQTIGHGPHGRQGGVVALLHQDHGPLGPGQAPGGHRPRLQRHPRRRHDTSRGGAVCQRVRAGAAAAAVICCFLAPSVHGPALCPPPISHSCAAARINMLVHPLAPHTIAPPLLHCPTAPPPSGTCTTGA